MGRGCAQSSEYIARLRAVAAAVGVSSLYHAKTKLRKRAEAAVGMQRQALRAPGISGAASARPSGRQQLPG